MDETNEIQNTNERFIKFISKLLYEHLYRKLQWLSITKPFQKSACCLRAEEHLLHHQNIPGTSTVTSFSTNFSFHYPLKSPSDEPLIRSYTVPHLLPSSKVVANIQPQRFLSINPLHNLRVLPAGIESSVY